jgi:hypothetical protein
VNVVGVVPFRSSQLECKAGPCSHASLDGAMSVSRWLSDGQTVKVQQLQPVSVMSMIPDDVCCYF